MRIAALAFGVLAGLIASLILALGGLDVASAGPTDRTAQAIRFFLVIVGNIGFFGGALTLAIPLAGAILLVAGALAWVAAALLLSASNLVLITPPLLLLFAAIPAFVAHFRTPRETPPEPEILAPLRPSRRSEEEAFDEPEVDMPSFGEPPRRGPTFSDAPRARASAFATPGADAPRDHRDWNPGKKRPVPPRARPAFRRPDVEEDDDDSPFSRFALSASSILSFGLYAALAGAALLVVWTLRGPEPDAAAVATADAPVLSAVSSAEPSQEPAVSPVLPALSSEPAPVRTVGAPPVAAAAAAAGALFGNGSAGTPAATTTGADAPQEEFGEVVMSDDPLMPPRLTEAPGLPFDETAVASIPAGPQPLELEPVPETASVAPLPPTVGPMMPYTMTPQMAALRTAAATGPTIVATPALTPGAPASSSGDAGL